MQDSFVAMHSKWARLHDPDKALAYLRQSVVNRSRSHLRHLSVVRRHAEREAPPLPGAAPTTRRTTSSAAARARGPAGAAPPAARGAGAALLPRPLGGRDRRRTRDQPRCGQEPRVPRRRCAPRRPRPQPRGDPMTDDDRLRRLLSDAVSDIEPRDRIAEIRASVHPDPQVVPMSRPRPWLYALAGAVASAAVIGVIAYTTNVLSGPDDGTTALAGAGQPSSPAHPPRPRPTPRQHPPARPRPRARRHHRRAGLRRLLRRSERGREAGALPRVAPRTAPAGGRPGRQRGRRTHRGGAGRDADAPARPRLRHALARPGDARLRVVPVDRRRLHPADRAQGQRRSPTDRRA